MSSPPPVYSPPDRKISLPSSPGSEFVTHRSPRPTGDPRSDPMRMPHFLPPAVGALQSLDALMLVGVPPVSRSRSALHRYPPQFWGTESLPGSEGFRPWQKQMIPRCDIDFNLWQSEWWRVFDTVLNEMEETASRIPPRIQDMDILDNYVRLMLASCADPNSSTGDGARKHFGEKRFQEVQKYVRRALVRCANISAGEAASPFLNVLLGILSPYRAGRSGLKRCPFLTDSLHGESKSPDLERKDSHFSNAALLRSRPWNIWGALPQVNCVDTVWNEYSRFWLDAFRKALMDNSCRGSIVEAIHHLPMPSDYGDTADASGFWKMACGSTHRRMKFISDVIEQIEQQHLSEDAAHALVAFINNTDLFGVSEEKDGLLPENTRSLLGRYFYACVVNKDNVIRVGAVGRRTPDWNRYPRLETLRDRLNDADKKNAQVLIDLCKDLCLQSGTLAPSDVKVVHQSTWRLPGGMQDAVSVFIAVLNRMNSDKGDLLAALEDALNCVDNSGVRSLSLKRKYLFSMLQQMVDALQTSIKRFGNDWTSASLRAFSHLFLIPAMRKYGLASFWEVKAAESDPFFPKGAPVLMLPDSTFTAGSDDRVNAVGYLLTVGLSPLWEELQDAADGLTGEDFLLWLLRESVRVNYGITRQWVAKCCRAMPQHQRSEGPATFEREYQAMSARFAPSYVANATSRMTFGEVVDETKSSLDAKEQDSPQFAQAYDDYRLNFTECANAQSLNKLELFHSAVNAMCLIDPYLGGSHIVLSFSGFGLGSGRDATTMTGMLQKVWDVWEQEPWQQWRLASRLLYMLKIYRKNESHARHHFKDLWISDLLYRQKVLQWLESAIGGLPREIPSAGTLWPQAILQLKKDVAALGTDPRQRSDSCTMS